MSDICSHRCHLLLALVLLTFLLLARGILFDARLFEGLETIVSFDFLGFLVFDGLLEGLERLVDDGWLALVLCRECETRARLFFVECCRRDSFLVEFVVILMGLY